MDKIKQKKRTIKTLDESRQYFIKTPQKGDKVKVYLRYNKVTYGVVRCVVMGTHREIAILSRTNKKFSLHECDFCLDAKKVSFSNI